jgi:hypothetical protein
MNIKECIDIVDANKPNQYTIKDKVMWLSFVEGMIINDVLKTHEGYDGRYDDFEGYSEDKLSVTLIVPYPYDRLYTAYLTMMIDQANGEMARYNNSMTLYNSYLMEYKKHYNKTHMPLSSSDKVKTFKPINTNVGLTDAEYEKLKTDLTYVLTEYFSDAVSPDKINDIVTNYMNTNAQMLKGKDGRDGIDGKDGYTPRKNVDYFDGKKGDKGDNGDDGQTPMKYIDYWTQEDIAEIERYIDIKTSGMESDIEGLREHINYEAHFRGYVFNNADLNNLEATPNDFVYSAESNTVWIYDEFVGWQNSNVPVPSGAIPLSDGSPLMDGSASSGTSEKAARGDHRHPTDTTRASVEELNRVEKYAETLEEEIVGIWGVIGNIDSALDELHSYAQGLVSGGEA